MTKQHFLNREVSVVPNKLNFSLISAETNYIFYVTGYTWWIVEYRK